MAFESGDQGSGLLGRVFTALGNSKKPDLRHIALSPQGDTEYSKLFEDYSSLLGNQKGQLADFTSQYKALTPQFAQLGQEDVGTYSQLLKNATARDPIADMARLGDYGFGKLTEWGRNMADYGTREDSLRKAAAGLGNHGPTAYDNILATNRISGNLLPAFNNIISNIGPNYSRASQDYFQNLQAIPQMMAGRYGALDQAPFRALVPGQIEAANFNNNLGSLNDLVKGQLDNWSFYVKPNRLQKFGNVMSGVYGGIYDAADAANKVSSAWGNVMSSGLGNQGQGGMPPSKTQSSSNSIDINQLLSMLGNQGGGGGGGGGGINMNQLMGLLGQLGIGRNNQVNKPILNATPNSLQSYSPYFSQSPQFNDTGFYQPPVYEDQAAAYSMENPYAQYGGYFN